MAKYRIVKVRDKYFVEHKNLIHYYRLSSGKFLLGFNTVSEAEKALDDIDFSKEHVIKYIKK